MAFFSLSVGLLNCALFGLFPVWMSIWSIITRPLFFVSGIFFVYESMPASVQIFLWFNPIMHLTGMMRDGFYAVYSPSYVSITFVLSISLVFMFFGVLLLFRYHRDILNDGG